MTRRARKRPMRKESGAAAVLLHATEAYCTLGHPAVLLAPSRSVLPALLHIHLALRARSAACLYGDRTGPTLGPHSVCAHPLPGESLPRPVPLEKIRRVILAERPRVTNFPIEWDSPPPT